MQHCASKRFTASTSTPSWPLQAINLLTPTSHSLLSILYTLAVLSSWIGLTPVECQRPLLNHTSYNSIAAAQQHNYLGSGKQLRNGRTRDMPMPQATMSTLTQRGMLPYDDFDGTDGTRITPLGGRGGRGETSRRRLNLSGLGVGVGRPDRGSGRRGIESLRKELMKPSVGGPGGGISGTNVGYPSYSATSSIGKIDGLGSLGPAERYGDQLRPGVETLYPSHYPPQFVVNQAGKCILFHF